MIFHFIKEKTDIIAPFLATHMLLNRYVLHKMVKE